jgi:hypothetical protein
MLVQVYEAWPKTEECKKKRLHRSPFINSYRPKKKRAGRGHRLFFLRV